jgi:hypothetical protein
MEKRNPSRNIEKITELARKEIDAIFKDPINEPTFGEFFRSRIHRTPAGDPIIRSLKIAIKFMGAPAYYLGFKLYKMGQGIAYEY